MESKFGNRLLIVDDDRSVLEVTEQVLARNKFPVHSCSNAREAITAMRHEEFDIVITDIKMPDMSGIDLLEKIRKDHSELPVILMTAYADVNIAIEALKKGAFDFIVKPYHPEYLMHSINKAVQFNTYMRLKENYKKYLEDTVNSRTADLIKAKKEAEGLSRDIVMRLTTIAEFRDMEEGAHVARIGIFSELIARTLGMDSDTVNLIKLASPLHDIGKISISEEILLKPSALTSEEFEVAKKHTTEGARVLSGSLHAAIKMAESIALNHHERWDGTGYPRGLKGENIPVEGRIVMLVDQYEALRSKRPYKGPMSHEKALTVITKGDGRTMPGHFDPDVMGVFKELESRFDELYIQCCKGRLI